MEPISTRAANSSQDRRAQSVASNPASGTRTARDEREDITGRLLARPHSWRFWTILGYVLIAIVFCVGWCWSLFGSQDGTGNIWVASLIPLFASVVVAVFIAWRTLASASHTVSKLERIRTDFVAGASHELKTPVAGIRLLSEGIQTAADDGDLETTRLFSARLDNEAERLQHLVCDLLDLSRLESEGMGIRAVTTDMHSTVTTSFEAHRNLAHSKGLEFVLVDETELSDDCRVAIDASDASLIVDNLLENAILYTEKGRVTLRFARDAHKVRIIVTDTGIGIPQADQSRIFERFYRVDAARSREVGGTGLGLSLVRHAVMRGQGDIAVNSTPNVGSSFSVTFPRA